MNSNQIGGILLLEMIFLVAGWAIALGNINDDHGKKYKIGVIFIMLGGYPLLAEAVMLCLALIFKFIH